MDERSRWDTPREPSGYGINFFWFVSSKLPLVLEDKRIVKCDSEGTASLIVQIRIVNGNKVHEVIVCCHLYGWYISDETGIFGVVLSSLNINDCVLSELGVLSRCVYWAYLLFFRKFRIAVKQKLAGLKDEIESRMLVMIHSLKLNCFLFFQIPYFNALLSALQK